MKKNFIIIVMVTILFLTCSKKETAVKPTQEEYNPTELLQQANKLYNEGNLEEAFRAYGFIYNRYPTRREYVDAVIGLSRCYNDMGEYEKGLDLLYHLVSENIIPSRIPEIYNEIAKYYEVNAGISSIAGFSDEEQDYQKAIEFYQKAIYYPNSNDKEAKAYAQYRIGELNIATHNFKDAVLAFKATIHNYPETKWAQLAKQRLEEFHQALLNVLNESTSDTQPQIEEEKITEIPDSTSKSKTPPKEGQNSRSGDTTKPKLEENLMKIVPDTSQKPELELK